MKEEMQECTYCFKEFGSKLKECPHCGAEVIEEKVKRYQQCRYCDRYFLTTLEKCLYCRMAVKQSVEDRISFLKTLFGRNK